MNKKLLIVDGNSILNRAFFALKGPAMLSTKTGTPTNAVYGFLNILNKYREEEKPEYLAVAFDLKAKTFRHHMYDGYKATRKGMPEELAVQLPLVKEALDGMNIRIIEREGLEADDIIGIYSRLAEDEGLDAVVLTGDRDALQLVSDRVTVIIPSTSKGKTETTRYDPKAVFEKYGVEPGSLIEVKALMGDSSDNIPGVPGVGEKTALDLIKTYGTLDNVYGSIENITKAKLKESLENNKELAYLSRELGTIRREETGFEDIAPLQWQNLNKKVLRAIFEKLEFTSLIKKMGLDTADEDEDDEGFWEAQAPNPEADVLDPRSYEAELITGSEDLDRAVLYALSQKSVCLYTLIDKTERLGGSLAAFALSAGDRVYVGGLSGGEEASSLYEGSLLTGGLAQEEAQSVSSLDEKTVALALGRLMGTEGVRMTAYNVKELYLWLLSYERDIGCGLFDIMLAEYLIDAQASAYLTGRIIGKYLGEEFETPESLKGKSKAGYAGLEKEALLKAVGDTVKRFGLVSALQLQKLRESSQEGLYNDVELPLALVLGSMEHVGFKVDQKVLDDFGAQLEKRIFLLEQSIFGEAGEEFNINSPKQLGVILFEKLSLRAGRKTKTGYSTDAEVLAELAEDHAIIPYILEYRQLIKLKSTYAEGLVKVIRPDTGRIHSTFNQTVTATGRISSTEPNLQNIPVRTELGREIRKAFVAQEGYVFVDADYSQIELRVLAHITEDEMLKKAFVEGLDIHTQTASQVFNVPKELVTGDMRRSAKAVNFGIVYGIGDFSLAKDIHVTKKEAARYIEGYLNTYPGVRRYMEDTVRLGEEKGYVETMFHRIRYIPELKASQFSVRGFGKRVAMNTPIQGSAADIIKIAMVNVWRELKAQGLKSRLILQVHDELIVETWEEELDRVKAIVKSGMESAVKLSVPLTADVSTGRTWHDAK